MEQNLYVQQSLLYHGWCMWVALLALSLSLLMVPCIEEGLMQKRREGIKVVAAVWET